MIKIFEKLTLILVVFMIGLAGYIMFTTKDNTSNYFLGYKPLIVETDRMKPDLEKNDIAIVHKTKNFKEGDIVCFVREEKITTHKIVDIKDGKISTASSYGQDPYKTLISDVDGKVLFKISIFRNDIKKIREDNIMGSIQLSLKLIIILLFILLIKEIFVLVIKNIRESRN